MAFAQGSEGGGKHNSHARKRCYECGEILHIAANYSNVDADKDAKPDTETNIDTKQNSSKFNEGEMHVNVGDDGSGDDNVF